MIISPLAIKIVEELESKGFEAYIVGGAVRDMMLELNSLDWDIATNANPDEILSIFAESFYDNAFGTVMVASKHLKKQFGLVDDSTSEELVFDITTYRTEGKYSDKRRPDNVSWGKTIEEDLKRRDFTINAMALRISKGGQEYELVDPYNGSDDLAKRIVRAVGVATERFEEDALRILRAVRIAAQLGFTIDKETIEAISDKAKNLKKISWERIGSEVMKLLSTNNACDGVLLMANCGVLEVVIPELMAGKNIKQAGHHIYDVFTHAVESLRASPTTDPVVRLAILLHDIDKPVVMRKQGVRGVTFYNHEVSGARTAKNVATRLKLSKKDQDRVFTLVRWHMFSYQPEMTDAAIRRFIKNVGKENISDMMALRVADRVGGGSKATSWRLTELQKRIGEQLYEPLSLKDLVVDGADVMRILEIGPSRQVGEILESVFEEVIEDSSLNNKDYLEKRIKELGKSLL